MHPFEGRTLKQWSKTLRSGELQRIDDHIKIGLVQGETGDQMARRLVGDYRLKGKGGVFEMTRQKAEATVRTAVNSYSNSAREMFLAENSDLFGEEIYVATLDSRTTPICRSLDGKKFPVGQGPIPPLHFNCRSIRVASITGEALGNRPAKPFTERQFVQQFAKQEGLGKISSRDKLPYGWKTKYDSFAGRRVREMTEILPAKISYQQWLTRQSVGFQNDVLGPTRAKLFRTGKLTLDKFVNRRGDEIPLADLAASDAAAFRAAGLDPGRFYR
jgi:SPP1 gp7 family putative phage head morphogenesis protein